MRKQCRVEHRDLYASPFLYASTAAICRIRKTFIGNLNEVREGYGCLRGKIGRERSRFCLNASAERSNCSVAISLRDPRPLTGKPSRERSRGFRIDIRKLSRRALEAGQRKSPCLNV